MNLKAAVWITAAAACLLLPSVASAAGNNRFARAYLSWSPDSRVSDTTIASPKTPAPLFLIIEGAGDIMSVSAILRWFPDGSAGAGYSLVAALLPSPYPDYATQTPPAEVSAGDPLGPYNSTIVMAQRSAARHAIAYWFVRTAPTAVRASFFAYLIRITDSAGQEDTLAITGAATVGGGAPTAADPGLRRIVPSVLGIDFRKGAVVDGPLTSATPGTFRFRSAGTAGLLPEVGIVRLRWALGRPSRAYENATNLLGEPVKLADLSGSYIAELHPDSLELRAAARLRLSPDVQGCAPLHPGVPMRTPTDSLFGMQWGLANHATVPCGNPVAGVDIGAEAAWDIDIGARPAVRVGVFDTGVARDHPEFTARLEAGPCTA
ncbi:MAG: hypothetical protein HZC42_06485 [Candidatus Eisenbacteria bacterium]|nr:hypothetical protein [Candidatus Eisenbacteria bacterium]